MSVVKFCFAFYSDYVRYPSDRCSPILRSTADPSENSNVMNGYVNFRGGAKPNLSGSTVLGHATIFPCRARLNSHIAGKK